MVVPLGDAFELLSGEIPLVAVAVLVDVLATDVPMIFVALTEKL